MLEQAAIDSDSRVITAELLRRIISLSLGSAEGDAPSRNCSEGMATAELPDAVAVPDAGVRAPATKSREWLSLEEVERDHIARTLDHTFNNRSAAARLLGVTRQSLLRKMKRYRLDRVNE